MNPFPVLFSRVILLGLTLSLMASAGATTVYYRMGEDDPGAASGGAAAMTVDNTGGPALSFGVAPTYSSDTPASQGSTLSLQFTGANYSILPCLPLTDDFVVDAWVKPSTLSGNKAILYNGQGGSNGWGLLQLDGNYSVLLGGVQFLGSFPATLNVWTHLTLEIKDGSTRFLVNGVLHATANVVPTMPAGFFTVGAGSESGADPFQGKIDEVRVNLIPSWGTNLPENGPDPLTLQRPSQTQTLLSWPKRFVESEIWYSPSLAPGSWTRLLEPQSVVGDQRQLTHATNAEKVFYRLVVPVAPPKWFIDVKVNDDTVESWDESRGDVGRFYITEQDGIRDARIDTTLNAYEFNKFDASRTYDRAGFEPENLIYEWKLFKSQRYGGGEYTSPLVTGRDGPILVIPENAMPDLADGPEDLEARFWRMRLKIRHVPTTPSGTAYEKVTWFRFDYRSSELHL
jgi:Concanavalin A-like lectin/glucanases superfamily